MRLELVNEVRTFNRATRRTDVQRFAAGSVALPASVEAALKEAAPLYGVNAAQMVQLVLCYYFGDGADHFTCEHCGFLEADGACRFPLSGEQTTLPLLDMGSVVVGLPLSDQGV